MDFRFRHVFLSKGISVEVDQDRRALDALYRVSSLAGESEDPMVALEGILDEVMRTFDAGSASISLLNAGADKLLIEVERGLSEDASGFELPIGCGITGWVALHGEAVLARPRIPATGTSLVIIQPPVAIVWCTRLSSTSIRKRTVAATD